MIFKKYKNFALEAKILEHRKLMKSAEFNI